MRTTSDQKGESIRIRLNSEMREYIEHKARVSGISISQVFRDMIQRDMAKRGIPK